MAGIEEYLEQIASAVYGKDVRQAIHDGIETCYREGKAGATDLVARARIDALSQMEEGSTTGDAELIDGRSVDGVTYPNIGGAIRSVSDKVEMIAEHTKNLWFNGNIVIDSTGLSQFLLKQPLPAGTYTLSCECTSDYTDSTESMLRFSTSQDASTMSGASFISDVRVVHSGERVSTTFTLSETAYSVRALSGTTTSNSSGNTAIYANVQVESGSSATAYIEPLTALDRCAIRATNIFITSGNIGSTYDDADDLPSNSIIGVHGAAGMAHSPTTATSTFVSFSYSSSAKSVQMVVPFNPSSDSNIYIRRKTDDGWTDWVIMNGKYDIYPTGDDTNRSLEIIAVLNSKGVCRLAKGDYYIDALVLQPNTAVIGCGNATRIIRKSDAAYNYMIRLQKDCKLEDVMVIGADEDITVSTAWERDTDASVLTSICGARIEGAGASDTNGMRVEISGVTFERFAGAAIFIRNTGYSPLGGCHIHDVFVRNCNAGIALARYAEFHRITGCSFHECYYGAINNGGNNVFENCDFSINKQGLLMDNSSGNYPNSSHGSFVGCTFNHSDDNNGTAIEVNTMVAGEMFVGCQIFYGAIVLAASQGVVFNSCNFGSETPITITDGGGVQFANCTFRPAASPTTDNRPTKTHFDNCYYINGTAVDGTPV